MAWNARQKMLRRFNAMHETLQKEFAYVAQFEAGLEGSPNISDMVEHCTNLKNALAYVDAMLDQLEARFRTGRWPEGYKDRSGSRSTPGG